MKILFVTELFSPSVGGMESRIKAWAEELVRQGHECEVWCVGHEAGLPAEDVIGGVRVRRIVAHPRYKDSGAARRHWPTVFKFCWTLWSRRRELAGFDGIILGKWPLLHALLVPYPRGVEVRQDWCEQRSGAAWQFLYRLMALPRRRGHVAINGGIAKWLTEHGVPRSRVATIGSASEPHTGPLAAARSDRRILFFGRLNEHKQPLLLLEAFASAGLGDRGYSLHFAGGGPQSGLLAERAASVSGVVLHGRVSDERKFELLAEASLLALPSLREGFPVSVAEACGVGTPTLTIDASDNGTAYIVRELGCGWVVENSLQALAVGMQTHACMASAEWQKCSARAVERSATVLTIDAQARALVDALKARVE